MFVHCVEEKNICSFMADVEEVTGRIGQLLSCYDDSQGKTAILEDSPEGGLV